MTGWGLAALMAGGAFTAATVYFAVARVPRWRTMEVPVFLPDFERVINVADKVQPMFLVATIVAATVYAGTLDGTREVLARAATVGFTLTMIGSLGFLVPLQRRMIKLGANPGVPIPEMRSRWLKGHLGRASLALVSYVLLTLAVVGVG